MKKIGLTGGIGSGKTYISKIFTSFGVPIFYADYEANKIVQESSNILSWIKEEFGMGLFKKDILDRKKFASIIFSQKEKLEEFNSLVHPLVKRYFREWCLDQDSKYVIKEAAILFEANSHHDLDKVICVSAPIDIRIERVIKRDNLRSEDVKKRIQNQLSEEDKKERSDYIIINDGKELILPQILAIHKDIIST